MAVTAELLGWQGQDPRTSLPCWRSALRSAPAAVPAGLLRAAAQGPAAIPPACSDALLSCRVSLNSGCVENLVMQEANKVLGVGETPPPFPGTTGAARCHLLSPCSGHRVLAVANTDPKPQSSAVPHQGPCAKSLRILCRAWSWGREGTRMNLFPSLQASGRWVGGKKR